MSVSNVVWVNCAGSGVVQIVKLEEHSQWKLKIQAWSYTRSAFLLIEENDLSHDLFTDKFGLIFKIINVKLHKHFQSFQTPISYFSVSFSFLSSKYIFFQYYPFSSKHLNFQETCLTDKHATKTKLPLALKSI